MQDGSEQYTDRMARFGCGALIGVVLVLGTLFGGVFYRLFRAQFESSTGFVWAFAIGLPLLIGILSVVIGWSLPEKLANILLKL
jgi:hypothetical protein